MLICKKVFMWLMLDNMYRTTDIFEVGEYILVSYFGQALLVCVGN